MADIIYVTAEGLAKLQEELKNLKEVKRIEIAEKLKEAISFGDLSENSEYEDARNEQAAVEKRIADLEEQLKNVEIIKEDAKDSAKDKVTMGSIVTVEQIDTKEKGSYKIVGSTESDILTELPRISNESPIGKALLGKKKGDTVKVNAGAGTFEYKIVKLG
ncbi:MAG: transcription elongation factor GreA [Candidatus Gracilibacteria bacterium]|nr:transcription elongation factor GreA [Candidatus Gracilibacteria bacterium]